MNSCRDNWCVLNLALDGFYSCFCRRKGCFGLFVSACSPQPLSVLKRRGLFYTLNCLLSLLIFFALTFLTESIHSRGRPWTKYCVVCFEFDFRLNQQILPPALCTSFTTSAPLHHIIFSLLLLVHTRFELQLKLLMSRNLVACILL